jgi:hypothetical protein
MFVPDSNRLFVPGVQIICLYREFNDFLYHWPTGKARKFEFERFVFIGPSILV